RRRRPLCRHRPLRRERRLADALPRVRLHGGGRGRGGSRIHRGSPLSGPGGRHMNENTKALSDAGVSIWLDDLSSERLTSGSLAKLIEERNVVGVTTNPTIFANAIAAGDSYEAAVVELAADHASVDEVITALTTKDVADACDLFAPVYAATKGFDGRVSIEVEPGLARDTEGTIAQAAMLHERVGRENVLIKIPATREGLEAIAATIGAGISVNVTLIFSLDRYRDVMNAYLTGLERAQQAGHDLSR